MGIRLNLATILAAVYFFLLYWPHFGLNNLVYALSFLVTFLLLTTNTAL